jgi:transglutaminase-like putative cysteine protease
LRTGSGGLESRANMIAPSFPFRFAPWLATAGLALACAGARAEEVLTEPPILYAEKLAPLLTPLEAVLKLPLALGNDQPSGAILLDERLQFVEADGRRLTVRHVAYKAITDAGAKDNAEDIFSYRKKEQKFYLVRAETIQPDGSAQPVRANAVLLQSPQRQAQYALYDDLAEVRIIYPNVKPGSVTHAIVVIEDLSVKMPGEYLQTFTWSRAWPTGRQHFTVDLPVALAARLQINSLGSGLPVLTRETLPGDRVRLAWSRDQIAPDRSESFAAPSAQVGPAIRLTTLTSWDQVGQWFNRLAAGRDQLAPALAAKVDEWTKGVTARDEIVGLLLAHAANDVRYTGLEFGAADYQPHDCNEVWENQYGDCKDKATLLAAFLRHKGIAANIVLLNTDHAGLVDRRSPSYQAFTHAIVALPDGKGGWQFCDPTITHARPGLLSPHDTDRDVLVVTATGAVWARTPTQPAGGLNHQFDLKLSPTGELSGWLTLTADGYYSANQRGRFAKLNPDETRDTLTNTLRGFYGGAEVIDVVRPAADDDSAPFTIKAYFIVAQQAESGGGVSALVFPYSGALFYDVGHTPERRSAYYVWRERMAVHSTVALPAGLVPARLPDAYRVSSPVGTMSAQWRFADGVCQMDLTLDHPQALISSVDFPVYYNALQSLRVWLEKPVVLVAGGPAPAASAAADLDLPLMPTGEGQINLVDTRYPESGNHTLRRAALGKTLQFFPNDKATVFRANVRLASLDWNEDNNQAAVDRLRPLLAAYKADVGAELYSYAESTLALALADLGKKDEAREIFVRLARAPNLSDFRRALEALHAGNLLRTDAPDEAIALLAEATKLDSEYRGDIYALLARLLLRQEKTADLRARLADLLQTQPQESEPVLAEIVQQSAQWHEPGEDVRQPALLALLNELVPAPGKDLQSALAEAKARQQSAQSAQNIQARLKQLAAATPPPAWLAPVADDTLKTFADYDRAFAEAEKKSDAARCVQLLAQALATLPPPKDFPRRLWQAASNADWQERLAGTAGKVAALTTLLDLCELLPTGDTYWFEGRLLRADRLARDGDFRAEHEIYRQLLVPATALPDTFLAAVYGQLALCLENQRDYAAALAAFRNLEPHLADSAKAVDQFLHAIFLNLHEGRPAEALRQIALLEKIPAATRDQTEGMAIITELFALRKSGRAEEFWAAQKNWWPVWETLAHDLGLPAAGPETVAPVVPDLTALGVAVGQAQRAKDRTVYFQTLRPIIAAARWLPSLAAEVSELNVGPLEMLPPEKRPDWRHLVIGILTITAPEPPESMRRRQVLLAANHFDAGQSAATLRIAAGFRAQTAPADSFTRAMNRMRGLAALALKKEQIEAAAVLEQDLRDADDDDVRAFTVGLLADLYHSLGRATDEEALLRRELANPIIIADKDGHETLTSRLDALTGPARFAKQVAAWVAAHQPPWYDFAEPFSLADPRLRDLEAVLKSPGSQFRPAEIIKLHLLVAQDPAQSPGVLTTAWREAISGLLRLSPTNADARQLLDSVLDEAAFDEDTVLSILWIALFDAYEADDRAGYARLRQNPHFAKFTATDQERLGVLTDYMAVDRTAKDSLLAFVKKYSTAPLRQMAVAAMEDIAGDLLRLGEIAAARDLAAQAATWQFAPDVTTPRQTIQLELARKIRAAETLRPLHETLIRRVQEKIATLPAEPPPAFAALRYRADPPALAPDLKLQACLWMIRTRQFDHGDLSFWSEFCNTLYAAPEHRALAGDLARLVLEQAGDDAQRAAAVEFCSHALDSDDPAARALLEPLFAKIRQPTVAPLTTAAIRLYEIRLALRTGQPVDLATAFDGLRLPNVATARAFAQIEQALQKRDLAALKRLIDALPPDQLLNPAMLRYTLPALDLLGLKDEAQLARETGRRELRELVLHTWANPADDSLARVTRLALILNEPGLLPPAWVRFVADRVPFPAGRLDILWFDAMQRKDWAAAVSHADALLKFYPTVYDFHLMKARALWAADRKAEAAEPLATYARYAKNEVDYSEAIARLKELGQSVP